MMDAQDIIHAMKRMASVDPSELTSKDLREAGCLERVCVLPENFRDRMSYLANVLVQSIRSSGVEDDQLRLVIGELCGALCYMMNSTSWRDGELHYFDREELKRKLSRFARD